MSIFDTWIERQKSAIADWVRRRLGLPDPYAAEPGESVPETPPQAGRVGGSDAFKISPEALQAARCAKMLGKWVHVGRVNEARRVQNWLGLADSIDGSGISRFDHMLKEVIAAIDGTHPQPALHLLECAK